MLINNVAYQIRNFTTLKLNLIYSLENERVNTLNWTKNYYATNSGFTFKLYLPKLKKIINYATYNNKNAIINANNPVASEKAKPRIA